MKATELQELLMKGERVEYEFRTDARFSPEKLEALVEARGERLYYEQGKGWLLAKYPEDWKQAYLPALIEMAKEVGAEKDRLEEEGKEAKMNSAWGALKVVEDHLKVRFQRISN